MNINTNTDITAIDKIQQILDTFKENPNSSCSTLLNSIEQELQLLKSEYIHPEKTDDLMLLVDSIYVNLPGYLWIKNTEGKYIFANKAFTDICGINSVNDIYGKTAADIWPESLAIKYTKDDERILKNKSAQKSEQKAIINQNQTWVKSYKAPIFNSKQEIIGLIGYSTDISKEKNAIETVNKLSQAIEQSPVSIIITDSEGAIEYANPKVFELTKYQPSQLVGQNPRILKSGLTDNAVYTNLWETITAGKVWRGDLCNKKSDGSLFWENATISPVRAESGEITNYIAIKEDITELRKKDEDIVNITEQLQAVTENISEVFCLLNKECNKIIYMSPAFETIWGIKSQDIIQNNNLFINSIYSEDKPKVLTDLVSYHSKGEFCCDFRIHNNGTIKWIQASLYPIKDQQNNIIRHVGIAIDITPQKQVEEDLRKSEEKYRLITENSSDVIWVYNLHQNRFTFVSSAIQTLRGISVEEAMQEKITDGLAVSSVDIIKKMISGSAAKNNRNTQYSIDEVQQMHKSGHWIWVEISSMLQYNTYDELELIGVSRDITKRKEAEQEIENLNKLQDVLVNMSLRYISMSFTDVNENIETSLRDLGRLISAERAMIFFYNWENNSCSCRYEWHEKHLQTLKNKLINVDLSDMPEWTQAHIRNEVFEIPVMENFYGLPRNTMLGNGVKSMISIPLVLNAETIGFITFDSIQQYHRYTEKEKTLLMIFSQLYSNLLQRKELKTKLIEEKENALKANKAKSEFLANMSHELRTPLNGVIGFSDLLAQTNMSDVQMRYTNAINTSANSLLSIINDILDFSKIEANKLDLDNTKTNFIELIEHCIDIISPMAEKKHLELLMDIDADVPHYIVTDSIRLSQVLTNLLSNAVKFTETGEVELKVSFTKTDKTRGKLNFSVRDTGIGISEEQRIKLFKAFSQADSSTTRKFGGTGLGLIISDLIVKKMGGKIELLSQKDLGTTFYFSIETDIDTFSYTRKNISFDSPVLIVEENKQSAQNIAKLLKQFNIQTVICENAYEAILILKLNSDFDIILVNNKTHSSDALKSIELICNKTGTSVSDKKYIIMHSSIEDYLFYEECNELGIHNFLTKPLRLSELTAKLTEITEPDSNAPETNRYNTAKNAKKQLTVIIADDDVFNMMLAKAMVNNIVPDSKIIEAKTGKEALEAYKHNEADLVIMDVQMPDMDGNDATMKIRKFEKSTNKHIPIIGLTAGALKEEMDKCLQSGMDIFLSKPIDSEKFKRTIENVLML